jgi:hypothetical protein
MQIIVPVTVLACIFAGCGNGRSKAGLPTCQPVVTNDGTVAFYRHVSGRVIAYARCGSEAKEMPSSTQYSDCPNEEQRAQLGQMVGSICGSSGPTFVPPTDAPVTSPVTQAPQPVTTAMPATTTEEPPRPTTEPEPTVAPSTEPPTTTSTEPQTTADSGAQTPAAHRFRTF